MPCRFTHCDGHAADFENLFERNRRRIPRFDRSNKRGCACVLALILPPQPLRSEARPSIRAQAAEIVQLQYPPACKDLDSFLGIGCMATRQVVNGSQRSILEAQSNTKSRINGPRTLPLGTAGDAVDYWAPRKKSQKIDEMAGLADEASSA